MDLKRGKVNGEATWSFERRDRTETHLRLDAICFGLEAVKLDTGKGFKAVTHSYDDESLVIQLGQRVTKGKLRVVYSAEPQRGLYFLAPDKQVPNRPLQVWSQCQDEDARHWVPCHDKPNVKATLHFEITVPKRFAVLCNGEPDRPRSAAKGRKAIYTFRMTEPVPSYLYTLVIGEFSVLTDRPALVGEREIPIEYWVPKGKEDQGRRAFRGTPEMIEYFGELTGVPFPYPRYTQVVVSDFTFGGMENTTATTMYEHILLDERAAIDIESDDLVAHELAHQWFGDWVTCRDWPQGWLNEGFATYFEQLELEKRKGVDDYFVGVERDLRSYLSEAESRYTRPIVERNFEAPIDLFDRHLYEKGGLVLHLLRMKLGDELFWPSIQHYLGEHGGGHATTEDLRRAFERTTGKNLERFFHQWVFEGGHPRIEGKVSWENGQLSIRLEQRHSDESLSSPRRRHFELPIEAEIRTKDGKTHLLQDTMLEGAQTFTFPCKEDPSYVALDPRLQWLASCNVKAPQAMLRAQLEVGTSARMRRLAAKQLTGETNHKTRDALAAALCKKSEHWSVRSACAVALGRIVTEASFQKLKPSLSDKDPRVRAAVAEALGEFRSDASLSVLDSQLQKEKSYLVAAALLKALGRTNQSRARAKLLKQLDGSSWASVVESAGLTALAALDNPEDYETMRRYAQYGNPTRLRRTAVAMMARLGQTPRVEQHLADLFRGAHPHFRESLVGALASVGTRTARAALVTQLSLEQEPKVIRRLREGIHELSGEQARGVETLRRQVQRLERELSEVKAKLSSQSPASRKLSSR